MVLGTGTAQTETGLCMGGLRVVKKVCGQQSLEN